MEEFANAEGTQRLDDFFSQHPDFLWSREPIEAAFYQDQVRKIFRGDLAAERAAVLLGLQRGAAFDDEITEPKAVPDEKPWQRVVKRLQDSYAEWDDTGPAPPAEYFGLPAPEFTINWQTGRLDLHFKIGLQQALYELLLKSWKAKVCPVCGRFFIATKTAQAYCLHACYTEMKNKRSLEHFYRRKGKK